MGDVDPESVHLRSEIPRLLDQFCAAVESPANRARLKLWAKPSFHLKTVKFRGQPLPLAETGGKIPIQADVYSVAFWGRIFGFSLAQYYTDPATYLHYYLKARLRCFEEIPDDSPLVPAIPVWIGLGFEASLSGVRQRYDEVAEPWVDRDAPVKEYEDLDRIGRRPDFKRAGLMPLAIRFHDEIRQMVDGYPVRVQFHDWIPGLLASMIYLRGYDALMVDMLEEPDFVHRMVRLVTDVRKQWELDRASYLDRPVPRAMYYDDDVNIPQLSPGLFTEFLLPYEKEVHDFQGGLSYWHSCGNITPFLPSIREMERIDLLNVSAWTDVRRAAALFGDTALEVCVHAVDDVLQASPEQMEARVRGLVEACSGAGVPAWTIRAEGITGLEDPLDDLRQVKTWVEAARRATEG